MRGFFNSLLDEQLRAKNCQLAEPALAAAARGAVASAKIRM